MCRAIAVAILSLAMTAPAFAAKPDGWITTKTKLALWTTAGVPSTDVNVDTINGVVTLHGKVDSDAQRMAAEREARKIDGVKQVRNLLQVVPDRMEKSVAKNDKDIKDSIEKEFKNASFHDSSISVKSVNAGVVLLGGKADNIHDELSAVRCAAGVPGVKRVVSEIKAGDRYTDTDYDLTASKDERRGRHAGYDGWITTDVKMRLLADSRVPALDINVDTKDNVVTLFGTVPSAEAKQDAEADARKVDRVASIKNELQVVPKSEKKVVKASDDTIEKDVKKAFEKNDALSHVDVEVKGGIVRLTGNVPSTYNKLEAATVSRSTPGVKAVNNDLAVKRKND